jgi:hypothetical protein
MMPSRTIASCVLGHDPNPLKHCAASAFHALSPLLLRPTLTVQPCCGSSSTPALSRANSSPVPPGGPTRQVPPSSVGSSSVCVSAVGTVVDVAPGSVVAVEPSGGVVVVVDPPASVVPAGGSVVVGAAPVDGDGGDVVVVVGAPAAAERRPAGNVVSPTVVGGLDGVDDVGASVVEDPAAEVVVAPAPVVVVSPGTVVEVAEGSWGPMHWITGRSVTMPATSAASNASRWSRTPGRSTTMF